MVIKGTEFNNAVKPITAVPNKKSVSPVKGNGIFARRFDTLELSDVFRKFSDDGGVKNQTDKIRKMLLDTETPENAEKYSDGLAGYAYMEMSLISEAVRTDGAIFEFSRFSEQKKYYRELIDKADGVYSEKSPDYEAGSIYEQINRENEKLIRENRIRNGYEYVENEDGTFDREKAESALANVQKRIDRILEETENRKGKSKTDLKTFNKCADVFADSFGTDSSGITLSEKDFDKLFGIPDVNEDNFLEKMKEKSESLWKGYNHVKKHFESCLEKIRSSGRNGGEREQNLRNALTAFYGKSFNDTLALLSELWKNEEKE